MTFLKPRLSLSGKLIAAFGISVSVTLTLAVAAIWAANHIEATIARLESSEQQLRALEQLATKLQKRHTAWTRFVYAGREEARREAAIASAEAHKLVNDLIVANTSEPIAAAEQADSVGPSNAAKLQRLLEFRALLDRVDAAWWKCVA